MKSSELEAPVTALLWFLAGVVVGSAAAGAVADRLARRRRSGYSAAQSALAHDMRSPISAIAAYAEIVQDDPTEAARFLGRIQEEAVRLNGMIEQRLGPADSGPTATAATDPVPARADVPVLADVPTCGDVLPGGRRILVVDDDRYIVEATRALLSRAGFQTTGAAGAEEALRRARSERPDLILLDLIMPGMGGEETLRRLRADPVTHDIPVIVTTGEGGAGAVSGASGVLTKPISSRALLGAVARAVEGAREPGRVLR